MHTRTNRGSINSVVTWWVVRPRYVWPSVIPPPVVVDGSNPYCQWPRVSSGIIWYSFITLTAEGWCTIHRWKAETLPADVFCRNLWNFQENMQVVASESLRNDFAEQMFTPKLSKIPEQFNFEKKKLPSSYHKNNDALKERCARSKVGK